MKPLVYLNRLLLVLLLPALIYAALTPGFSILPATTLLRHLGFSYHTIHFLGAYSNDAIHFIGAFFLTLLLPVARAFGRRTVIVQRRMSLVSMALLAPVTESVQWLTGRDFQLSDILLHLAGMAGAACCWFFNRARIT